MEQKSRILIAEDECVVALDIQSALETLGHTVVGVVESAEEALLKALDTKPDVIFMDIHLQGKGDGIEAATKIRAHFETAIVFLTAHSDEATLMRARTLRPDGYILKPFDDNDIRVAVELATGPRSFEAAAYEESIDELPSEWSCESIARYLHSISLFKMCSFDALSLCAESCTVKNVEANEYIWSQGNKPHGALVTISGRFAATKTSLQGKELTVALLSPGDAFSIVALESGIGDAVSLRAMLDSRCVWIPKAALQRLRNSEPSLMISPVTIELGKHLNQAYELARILAYSPVEHRIILTLLTLIPSLAKGKESDDTRKLFLTRKELADLCGTTPETAIRVTKNLERDGLLNLTRPGIIKINSMERLSRYVESAM